MFCCSSGTAGFNVGGASPPGSGVTSFNGRAGVVVSAVNDYNTTQVQNVSGVAGASCGDALDTLAAAITALGTDDLANDSDVAGTTASDALDNLLHPAVTTQAAAAYDLAAADAGTYIRRSNGSAQTITIPLDATVPFPIGTQITVEQSGVGQLTVVAAGGVTLRIPSILTAKVAAQYGRVYLEKVDTNEWSLDGLMEAA